MAKKDLTNTELITEMLHMAFKTTNYPNNKSYELELSRYIRELEKRIDFNVCYVEKNL